MRLLPLLPVTLLLAGATSAQSALLTRTGGTIGKTVDWTVSSQKAWMWIPSLNAGPTPLALLDASDTRSLAVGLDLLPIAAFGLGGNATKLSLPIPNDKNFAGLRIRAQFFNFPGASRLVDEVSNDTVATLGVAASWYDAGKVLNVARALASVSELQDRRVLVAGGGSGSLLSARGLDTSEIYERDRQRFVAGPRMTVARALHVAVTLADGRVLLAGGVDATGKAIPNCEIYDPKSNRFTTTASMNTPRVLASAAILPNGHVLVTGGVRDISDPIKALNGILKSTEIFDPVRGSWSVGPNMRENRAGHHSIIVSGGRVLQVGGLSYVGILNLPGTTTECELYVPTSNSFANTGKLPYDAAYSVLHALRPVGGSANEFIAVGGFSSGLNLLAAKPLDRAAVYNDVSGTWRAVGNLPGARVGPTLGVAGGDLLVCGGAAGSLDKPSPLASCARYSVTSGTFTSIAPLPIASAGGAGISLESGQLLIAGGGGGTTNIALDRGFFYFAP